MLWKVEHTITVRGRAFFLIFFRNVQALPISLRKINSYQKLFNERKEKAIIDLKKKK